MLRLQVCYLSISVMKLISTYQLLLHRLQRKTFWKACKFFLYVYKSSVHSVDFFIIHNVYLLKKSYTLITIKVLNCLNAFSNTLSHSYLSCMWHRHTAEKKFLKSLQTLGSIKLVIHTKTTVGFLGNLVRKFGFLKSSITWICLMLETDQNLCSGAGFSSHIMWLTTASSPSLEDLTSLPESAGPHTSTRWYTQTSRFLCDQSWLWRLTIINKARNLDQILSILLKTTLEPFSGLLFPMCTNPRVWA